MPLSLTPQSYLLLGAPATPGAIAGTVAFAMTVTGDLRVPAALAGSLSFTLTATGTLSIPPAALAGALDFRMSVGAALTVPGTGAALAGALAWTMTAGGALTVTGAAGALAGGLAFTLTATGTLTALRANLGAGLRFVLTVRGALATDPRLRALRSETIQRPIGRVEQTAPTAAPLPGVLRFALDSSLDTPADGWTAEVAGAALMLAPDDEALYRLPIGFLDDAGAEVLATHVTSGRILDRRLVGRWPERRTYVRGVDALERTFRIQRRVRYVPLGAEVLTIGSAVTLLQPALSARQAELAATLTAPGWPSPELQAQADFLQGTIVNLEHGIVAAQEEQLPQKVGAWSAKTIAADLLVGTGLTLAWTARDYSLSVPFDAVGTLYELLRRLAEPWNQIPALGVDVTAVGAVVHVRPRLLSPPADLTMTVAESRLVEIELGDRRRLPLIGVVTLEGRIEQSGAVGMDPGDTTIFPPIGMMTQSEVDVPFDDYTKDAAGNDIARVRGVRTYRMPDRLLLRYHEEVFTNSATGMKLVKAEDGTYTYEDSRYGPQGPTNQPLPLSIHKDISTPFKSGEVETFGITRIENTTWTYDGFRYLTATATTIQKRVDSEGFTSFPHVETVVESRTKNAEGWFQLRTTRTTYDPKTGKWTSSASLQPQDQAGFPPGGPRPPFSLFGARIGNDPEHGPVASAPVRLRVTISTDPTAIPISYANPNLALPDLEFIAQQCRDASGLVEYPLRAGGPALPDVVKGIAVHLTAYVDADGTPIPLDPAQVRSIAFGYDVVRGFTCAIAAVFYRAT